MPRSTRRRTDTNRPVDEASEAISDIEGRQPVSAAANGSKTVVVHREIYDDIGKARRESKSRPTKAK